MFLSCRNIKLSFFFVSLQRYLFLQKADGVSCYTRTLKPKCNETSCVKQTNWICFRLRSRKGQNLFNSPVVIYNLVMLYTCHLKKSYYQ